MSNVNVGPRIQPYKTFVRSEADLVKGMVNNVRDRVGRTAADNQPRQGQNLGGIFGKRGGLGKGAVAFVSGTIDNLEKMTQEKAAMRRQSLGHRRV